MTRSRWLAAVAICGAAILALSLLPGWIAHDREIRGEGYRHAAVSLSAWRSSAIPVLTLGVLAAAGAALAALVALGRPASRLRWVTLVASVLALVLIGASLVPVAQEGHASSVELTAGWLGWVGLVLAALMVVASSAVASLTSRQALAVSVAGVVTLAVAAGGRSLGLQWTEGTGQHWTAGSYTRPSAGGQPQGTLTLDDGRFRIDDRWSGAWESSGWTVVLVDDPACPDSRGTYHAHGAGEDGTDLRFVKVVDTCQDGARAAELETGIWDRDP